MVNACLKCCCVEKTFDVECCFAGNLCYFLSGVRKRVERPILVRTEQTLAHCRLVIILRRANGSRFCRAVKVTAS